MFEQALEFMQTIITYYGKQKIRLHYNEKFEGLGVNYCKGSHITSCLDYVIMICVMNQSYGLWLLSNALTIAMTLTIKLQVEMIEMVQVSNGTKTLAQFDYELLFQRSM
jgi:hypothetical protein